MAWDQRKVRKYMIHVDYQSVITGVPSVAVQILGEGGGVFWLIFSKQVPMPASNVVAPGAGAAPSAVAHCPWSLMDVTVKTLREEAPLFLLFEPENNWVYLSTDHEPPGEGPIDGLLT